MTARLRRSMAAALVCLFTGSGAGQTTDPVATSGPLPTQAESARPCVDAQEHRQLDFWIGEWDVTPSAGTTSAPPARSRIELIEDQCVILETYSNPNGYSGRSLNAYHPEEKRWEQFWVDNKGAIHHYTGHFQDGMLRYQAEGIRMAGPASPIARVKMTFFDQGPDQVRQLGEQSTDGETWTVAYDLIYRRRKESAATHCAANGGAGAMADVRAVADALIAADNARAIERVIDLYAPDALLVPPNEPPVVGQDGIRPRYESLFSSFKPAIEGRIDRVCVSERVASVQGHNAGRMIANDGGRDRVLDDTYVMLLRKDTGQRWRISHLIWHEHTPGSYCVPLRPPGATRRPPAPSPGLRARGRR